VIPGVGPGPCGLSIDGADEAFGESDAVAAPGGREVVRLEAFPSLRVQGAAHVAVDEVVFDDAEARCELIVGNAGLVEVLGLLVGEKPQYVANELIVIGY